MAILYVWTTANSNTVKQVIGPTLRGKKVPHKFYSSQDFLPSLGKGDIVIALGKRVLTLLQVKGVLQKGRAIGSMRGQSFPMGEGRVILSYDPYVASLDHSIAVNLQIDMALAIRILTTGTIEPKLGNYVYKNDFHGLITTLKSKYKKSQQPSKVSLDLETVTTNPYSPNTWIVSVSVTIQAGESTVVYLTRDTQPQVGDELWMQIHWLCTSDQVGLIGANLKFDAGWIREKWGIVVKNIKFDTLLIGSLLDENRSNSLNTHAKVYTTMGGYDDKFNLTHDKSRMDLVPKEELLPYAGGDTDAAYQVADVMREEILQDNKLTRFYLKLLLPASNAFGYMERVGILLDVPYYNDLGAELELELETLNANGFNLINPRLQAKYGSDFKLTKAAVIIDHLFSMRRGLGLEPRMFTEKTGAPSTAWKHLKLFMEHPEAGEFIQALKKYNSANKTLGTYVNGFLAHLCDDGLLHPTAILYRGAYNDGDDSGTITGRLAFKDPAVQTIPKHTAYAKALRRGYIAPPGYVIINWDYSQGELRVTAVVAKEENMLRAYQQGIDLHMITGGTLNGYDFDDMVRMKEENPTLFKRIRQGGKAGNFGLIYGMKPKGYKTYAYDTYGVSITEQEAEQQSNMFFDMYPRLPEWHRESKERAHRLSGVRSPLGRIRHLPLINSRDNSVRSKAERQSINSPVQATLSDMSQLALSEFHRIHGEPDDCKFFLMTHDSLSAYVQIDRVHYWGETMKEIMEHLPLDIFDWHPEVPFTVDWEVGNNLAEMEEMT